MTVTLLHATTVALDSGAAVALSGPSGSGKSRMALRLIRAGARLVADDRTLVWRCGQNLFARAPRAIAGLIEVRGLGMLRLSSVPVARLVAVLDMDSPPARLPEPRETVIDGIALPVLGAAGDPFPHLSLRYIVEMSTLMDRP